MVYILPIRKKYVKQNVWGRKKKVYAVRGVGFRAVCQWMDLQVGQIVGSSGRRGIQVCPHRRQVNVGSLMRFNFRIVRPCKVMSIQQVASVVLGPLDPGEFRSIHFYVLIDLL